MTSFKLFGDDGNGEVGVWYAFDGVDDLAISVWGGATAYLQRAEVARLRDHLNELLGPPEPPSKRLPATLWRVLATGGKRQYWEGASKTYTTGEWARDKARTYFQQGASDARVYRGDLTWVDVTTEENHQ